MSRLVSTVGSVGSVGLAAGLGNSNVQSLESIADQVLRILNTAAKTDQVIKDTNSLSVLLGNTSMGHAAGHLNEGLDTTERLSERKQLSELTEAMSSLLATLDAERDHSTAQTITVLLESN